MPAAVLVTAAMAVASRTPGSHRGGLHMAKRRELGRAMARTDLQDNGGQAGTGARARASPAPATWGRGAGPRRPGLGAEPGLGEGTPWTAVQCGVSAHARGVGAHLESHRHKPGRGTQPHSPQVPPNAILVDYKGKSRFPGEMLQTPPESSDQRNISSNVTHRPPARTEGAESEHVASLLGLPCQTRP